MLTVGIDVGGMSIKVGLVDENGVIIAKNAEKTEKDPREAVKSMVGQIERLLEEKSLTVNEIDGIGIGVPGTVSSANGKIGVLTNLKTWNDFPIVKEFEKYINKPVTLSNDANVATLAEVKYGVAKGYDNCIMFTLGTGVGGGIVIDKKLYEGKDNKGAELGHVTLIMGGEPCGCGRRGCIETYVSATALMKQTREAMQSDANSKMWEYAKGDINNVNGLTSFECAKAGDVTAEKVVSNYVAYLAESMMNMINIFRPDVFLLGGGVSNQGDYLIDRLKAYCEKYHYGYKGTPAPEIKIAQFGNDAGIIGSAALLRQN